MLSINEEVESGLYVIFNWNIATTILIVLTFVRAYFNGVVAGPVDIVAPDLVVYKLVITKKKKQNKNELYISIELWDINFSL